LTQFLEVEFISYRTADVQGPNAIATFLVASDAEIAKRDPPKVKFWNLEVQNQTDGGWVVTGTYVRSSDFDVEEPWLDAIIITRLFDDSSNDWAIRGSNIWIDHSTLRLPPLIGSGGTATDSDQCGDPEADEFYLSNGSTFLMTVSANGTLTFDIHDAVLWCGECGFDGLSDAASRAAYLNVGKVSVGFTSWMPPQNDTMPSKPSHGVTGLPVTTPNVMVFSPIPDLGALKVRIRFPSSH
jgi:hypothetical protein